MLALSSDVLAAVSLALEFVSEVLAADSEVFALDADLAAFVSLALALVSDVFDVVSDALALDSELYALIARSFEYNAHDLEDCVLPVVQSSSFTVSGDSLDSAHFFAKSALFDAFVSEVFAADSEALALVSDVLLFVSDFFAALSEAFALDALVAVAFI